MINSKGLTTGQLLLLLGVVVVMFGVIFYFVNPFKRVSEKQDTKRKEDLLKIQKILEAYYQDYAKYPEYDTSNYTVKLQGNSVSWGSPFLPYAQLLPRDPNSKYRYVYVSDPSNNFQTYRLYAVLENKLDPSACNMTGASCQNVPSKALCGDAQCNYGVTSKNTSP